MAKVFIVGPYFQYRGMFIAEGWEVVRRFADADLIQFTGGEDVNPRLYGQNTMSVTCYNEKRDTLEQQLFHMALKLGKPMAGICRGGQFLNVMNGGEMWQDADGHAIKGTHAVIDSETGETFQVTSTHHQIMIPAKQAITLAYAQVSKRRTRFPKKSDGPLTVIGASRDAEVVFYRETNCLCFQPHPEFPGYSQLRKKYFEYLDDWCFSPDRVEARDDWSLFEDKIQNEGV